jgi:hypothetical protein
MTYLFIALDINREVFQHLKPFPIEKSPNGVFMSKDEIYQKLFVNDLIKPLPTHEFYQIANKLSDNIIQIIKKIVSPSSSVVYHELHYPIVQTINFRINEGGGEALLSGSAHNFFTPIFESYCDYMKDQEFVVSFGSNQASTTLTSARNSKSTSEKNTQTRRDFLCYVNDVLVIFGEEKSDETEMDICIQQLEDNTGQMISQVYGDVPFVLCYALAGHLIHFYAYMRSK